MPAATQNAGTDKFTDFEERRYTVRVKACKDTTSPPPDSRPQYEWEMALEGSADPETGAEMSRRMWCSTIWNATPEKESHLVLIARALIGPNVTVEEWEALDFPDLVGLRGSALVALDAKGYPTIDKTTFRPVAGKAKAAPSAPASIPPTPVVVAPARPALPSLPQAQAGPPTLDAKQIADVRAAWAAKGYGDDAALEAWAPTQYGGRTLYQIRQDEWDELAKMLDILPF